MRWKNVCYQKNLAKRTKNEAEISKNLMNRISFSLTPNSNLRIGGTASTYQRPNFSQNKSQFQQCKIEKMLKIASKCLKFASKFRKSYQIY